VIAGSPAPRRSAPERRAQRYASAVLRKLLTLLRIQGHGAMLKPGDEAPDFTARDQHGNDVALRDCAGLNAPGLRVP
jgi:hypothetical protein